MLNKKEKRSYKLTFEILIIITICFAIAVLLFFILSHLTLGLINEYNFYNDIILDEFQLYELDKKVFLGSFIISFIVFSVLFGVMFSNKLVYIKELTNGIDELRKGNYDNKVSIKGNNELSSLANSINYLSLEEKSLKEKENKLKEEKDELIRSLSHDIRTPLTSIISYTELRMKQEYIDKKQQDYHYLVLKKAKQIKDLTDVLLDGGKREITYFDDARLLIRQLVEEFEETLEDSFKLSINILLPNVFCANLDIYEIRRIFDNLITNIQKYADSTKEVELLIAKDEQGLLIKQRNFIKENLDMIEGHNIGLKSIARIAQNYDGNISVNKDENIFEIIIVLENL